MFSVGLFSDASASNKLSFLARVAKREAVSARRRESFCGGGGCVEGGIGVSATARAAANCRRAPTCGAYTWRPRRRRALDSFSRSPRMRTSSSNIPHYKPASLFRYPPHEAHQPKSSIIRSGRHIHRHLVNLRRVVLLNVAQDADVVRLIKLIATPFRPKRPSGRSGCTARGCLVGRSR